MDSLGDIETQILDGAPFAQSFGFMLINVDPTEPYVGKEKEIVDGFKAQMTDAELSFGVLVVMVAFSSPEMMAFEATEDLAYLVDGAQLVVMSPVGFASLRAGFSQMVEVSSELREMVEYVNRSAKQSVIVDDGNTVERHDF